MRKYIAGAVLASALAIPAAATAVDLHTPHLGSGCPTGYVGDFHFVNNQTGGAAVGTLTAVIGGTTYVRTGRRSGPSVQHFYIDDAEGSISSASTNLPGKLVLSDLSCEVKK